MESHLRILILIYAYPLGLYTVLLISPFTPAFPHTWTIASFPLEDRSFTLIWFLQLWLSLCLLSSAILASPSFISALRQNLDVELTETYLVSYAAVALYFAAGLLPDPYGPFQPSLSHLNVWILAAVFELLILILAPAEYKGFATVQAFLRGARILILICISAIYVYIRRSRSLTKVNVGETERILNDGNSSLSKYGVVDNRTSEQAPASTEEPKRPGWLDYFVGFRVLLPYIWPSNSRKQQLILFVSLLLMIGQRIMNVLVPFQLGVLIEAIGVGKIPYKEIFLYVLFRGLQGQQGVLGSLRAILWIPISQSLFRQLSCGAFQHILTLSLEFHLSNKVGEVMAALSKGSALNTFLDSFAFNLFPMVFDLGVAAIYFIVRFDAFYSLILIGVMWCYVYMTIYMAQWRGKRRREMALKDREMNAVKMDTMLSYENVHHNDAVSIEVERYRDHVSKYQKAEFSVLFSLNALNISQNLILILGILLVILLSSLQISIGMHTVAMFVSILAYFTQLQAPLQFFGSFYSQVQNNLVDAERMLDLFKEKPTITDAEHAIQLADCDGRISFSNVSFTYDGRKPSIQNVSFIAEPGTSTAIVGESGGGKSTCLKLLFRFYDVTSGSIKIDGHDIRDLGSTSYRAHIGVVPQDTILFNSSIIYNLQYAKPDATEEEVHEACRAASIHDKIMNFPNGYETKVGERGLRLSGGEKQRIAIARVILKHPQVILLDEATASLDSRTEKQIQEALETVTKGRTTITIAHRLSTITKSDQILVLHEGRIVETGTHQDLLTKGGRYSKMWEKQTKAHHRGTNTSE